MRQILAFAICLCFLLFGRSALAYFEPVYAPLSTGPVTVPSPTTDDATLPAPVALPPENAPLPVSEEPLLQKMTLVQAVAKGKELLAPVLVDFKKKEKGIAPLTSKTSQTAAALAIWDKNADTVTVYGGTRGAKYFTADLGGPVVPIIATAGSQTAYRDEDSNTVVVGTVQADMVAVTIKKKKRFTPVFSYYVPYTKELYSPETLATGSDYLSSLIEDAFNDLDAKGIMSRAFPDQKLTEVVDPYLIKSIAVIEHADGQIFEENNSEDSLGRFLVKLAVNKEGALGGAVSVAGARGMVQFIPSTYKLMVTKRPDLELIADFVTGMADHKNAVKAEAAYLDMILASLPASVKDLYTKDRGAAAEYLAAGYNGGEGRVKKAIKAWGEEWSLSHGTYAGLTAKANTLKARIAKIDKQLAAGGLSKQKIADLKAEKKTATADRAAALALRDKVNTSTLRNETIAYVVKFRRVYDMLAAGFFATPAALANALPSVAVASPSITAANTN